MVSRICAQAWTAALRVSEGSTTNIGGISESEAASEGDCEDLSWLIHSKLEISESTDKEFLADFCTSVPSLASLGAPPTHLHMQVHAHAHTHTRTHAQTLGNLVLDEKQLLSQAQPKWMLTWLHLNAVLQHQVPRLAK